MKLHQKINLKLLLFLILVCSVLETHAEQHMKVEPVVDGDGWWGIEEIIEDSSKVANQNSWPLVNLQQDNDKIIIQMTYPGIKDMQVNILAKLPGHSGLKYIGLSDEIKGITWGSNFKLRETSTKIKQAGGIKYFVLNTEFISQFEVFAIPVEFNRYKKLIVYTEIDLNNQWKAAWVSNKNDSPSILFLVQSLSVIKFLIVLIVMIFVVVVFRKMEKYIRRNQI